MNISRTVGGFSFISNPHVRVLSFTAAENKSNEIKDGVRTTHPPTKVKRTMKPITDGFGMSWFKNGGRFNNALYEKIVEGFYK